MGAVIENKMYVSAYMYIFALSACLVFSKDEDVTISVEAHPRENMHEVPEGTFTVIPGTAVTLRCRLDGYRRSLFDWDITALAVGVKSEVQNPNTGAFEVLYFISQAQVNNSGEYKCFDNGGKSHSVSVSVKKIICEEPGQPTNGKAFYGLLELGYKTTYECNTGYRLSHNQSRTCGPEGKWNGTEPFCQVVQCGTPESPKNGEAMYVSVEYNSLVWYKCYEGYNLSSSRGRKCGANGQWIGYMPYCKVISCRKPKNPENGRVLYSSREYKSELKYVCNIGYNLSSDQTRICGSDGKWNGTEPLCTVIRCETPEDLRHGKALYNSTEYNSKLKYKCDEGYQLSIIHTRTCASDGKWTSSGPSCEVVCQVPAIRNGAFGRYEEVLTFGRHATVFKQIPEGTFVHDEEEMKLKCNENYVHATSLKKEVEITCQSGQLLPAQECTPIPCQVPPIRHGTLRRYEEEYAFRKFRTVVKQIPEGAFLNDEEEVKLKCNENYVHVTALKREVEITCRSGQLFPEPECRPSKIYGKSKEKK